MNREVNADVCVIGGRCGPDSRRSLRRAGEGRYSSSTAKGSGCINTGWYNRSDLRRERARQAETGGPFGVTAESRIDFGRVHAHVHEVIAAIAPHDSVERFERLGVEVIREEAHFVGPRAVSAGDARVRSRRVVIATGSSPAIPDIEGLRSVPYFTNETIFDHSTLPAHLAVIGGGPRIDWKAYRASARNHPLATAVRSTRPSPSLPRCF